MTDLEFLKGCGVDPDSENAALALKLREYFASNCSNLSPEAVVPQMTCKALMTGRNPEGKFQDGFDPVNFVVGLEEKLGISISDENAEYLLDPYLNPERTVKDLIRNYLDVLDAQKRGTPIPPRSLTFWTGKRHDFWLAWGMPIFGILTLMTALVGIPRLVKVNAWYPLCIISIISLFVIWLGSRLWKCHRVTLDHRLFVDKKYRAVLYLPGRRNVVLEELNFVNYLGWEFPDAATAEKRSREIAAFLNLPLETYLDENVNCNPPDWSVIDTKMFFCELAAFCEQCKAAGYSAAIVVLLNQIRQTDSFCILADAIVELDAKLPDGTLIPERKSLLESAEQTAVRVTAYHQFLQDCGVQAGTLGALLAVKLRKLWAVGTFLSEDEITAEMQLGELAPQWFPPEDLDPDTHEEKVLAWGICLGEYYDTLYSLNPQPDWTIGELVRKVTEAAEAKNQMGGRKLKPWQERVITLFCAFILSFFMTGFYSLHNGSAWSWRIWMSLLSILCIVWLVTVWRHSCKKPKKTSCGNVHR